MNVRKNTSAIISTNTGRAVYLPVSTLSMRRLRRCSLLSRGFMTHSAQIFSMNEKRISAIAALRSRPRSFSIWTMICSSASFSFSSSSS